MISCSCFSSLSSDQSEWKVKAAKCYMIHKAIKLCFYILKLFDLIKFQRSKINRPQDERSWSFSQISDCWISWRIHHRRGKAQHKQTFYFLFFLTFLDHWSLNNIHVFSLGSFLNNISHFKFSSLSSLWRLTAIVLEKRDEESLFVLQTWPSPVKLTEISEMKFKS